MKQASIFPFVVLASATLAGGAADSSDACHAGRECPPMVEENEEVALLQRKSHMISAAAFENDQKLGPDDLRNHDLKCSRVSYEARYALPSNAVEAGMVPPLTLATEDNMDPKLKTLGLDFSGLWWTRDNPAPSQIVSFANAKTNSSTYPAQLYMLDMLAGHWSFLDATAGRSILTLWSTMNPMDPMVFNFENSKYGDIPTELSQVPLLWVDEYLFQKIDNDSWLRYTTFQDKSAAGKFYQEGHNYTLVRVAYEDGTPHPKYWPEFLKRMEQDGKLGAKKLVSFASDNTCMRACENALSCGKCQYVCGAGGGFLR